MQTQNSKRCRHHQLLTLTILSLPLLMITTVHSDQSSSPSPSESDGCDYIRTCCENSTLYPDICFSSLSRYSNSIHNDPVRLALAAVSVAHTRTRNASSFVSSLSDPSSGSVLHDCTSLLRDATSRISDSLGQMKQMMAMAASQPPETEEFRFWVSNVQTWMSAALSDDETCTDGFGDVAEGSTKGEVYGRVEEVKKVTSNALALFDIAYAATS